MLGDYVSKVAAVSSGVVQGSVLGPAFFTVFIDPLLCRLNEHIPCKSFAFANDVKFVSETGTASSVKAQVAIDIVKEWSDEQEMLLSVEKSSVLHCGIENPCNQYKFGSHIMPATAQNKDLGVVRSECRLYRDHVAGVATSCSRLAGMIRRAFKTRNTDLLWMAFQVYVKPKIMYASSEWSPLLKCDVTAIERIQRRFTKALPGLTQLSYEQRLKTLKTLSLEQSKNMADLVFVYRCLHHLCDINLQDVSI